MAFKEAMKLIMKKKNTLHAKELKYYKNKIPKFN